MSFQIPWWVLSLIYVMVFVNVGKAYEETKVHIVYLGERQHDDPKLVTTSHLDMLESLLGSKKEARESIVHSYHHGISGFAAHLTDIQAKKLAEHPRVVHVKPNSFYKPQTTRTYDYLGLSLNSPKRLLHDAKMGEDVIIGVIDSGIWPELPSFNDNGIGPIPKRWKGECVDGEEFDKKKHCNKKIIGARYYIESLLLKNKTNTGIRDEEYISAREGYSHGTPVASIAAGSFVPNVSYFGHGLGTARGGAPKARLAIYKVCWQMISAETCGSADVLKAIDDAIKDGVDLIQISLSKDLPLRSEIDLAEELSVGAWHAMSKGIPVVAAASNDGPNAGTVNNVYPWIITVGATTNDQWFATPMQLGNNVTLMARTPYSGEEVNGGLVYLKSTYKFENMAKGKIGLIFQYKGQEQANNDVISRAMGAEAKGLILVNTNDDVITVSVGFPIIVIDFEQGTAILKYIRSFSSPTIKISSAKYLNGPLVATKVADFSSRGPNSLSPSVLKPDIAAPGVGILAAVNPSDMNEYNGFTTMSGTSMATPVVSGVIALLKSVHPKWSIAALKSAIVTTASKIDPYGEPIFAEGVSRKLADPFDYGGGLVDANKATDPGLVYDTKKKDYIRFFCASRYDETSITKFIGKAIKCPTPLPSILDLNLPSITIPFLKEDVTITRIVTNVGPIDSVYNVIVDPPLGVKISVTPNTLVFKSSVKKLAYKVKVSTTHKANSIYYFGSLTWTDGSHNVTIPLSVRTQKLMYFDY